MGMRLDLQRFEEDPIETFQLLVKNEQKNTLDRDEFMQKVRVRMDSSTYQICGTRFKTNKRWIVEDFQPNDSPCKYQELDLHLGNNNFAQIVGVRAFPPIKFIQFALSAKKSQIEL